MKFLFKDAKQFCIDFAKKLVDEVQLKEKPKTLFETQEYTFNSFETDIRKEVKDKDNFSEDTDIKNYEKAESFEHAFAMSRDMQNVYAGRKFLRTQGLKHKIKTQTNARYGALKKTIR